MGFINKQGIIFWLTNIIIALLLLVFIGYFVLVRLDTYTLHGHFITVPDLRGLKPNEATTLLKGKELQFVVTDSIYDNQALPGCIVEQFPSPNARVKNNRVLQLTINANTPEKIIFPNLRNTGFRQALQKLRNLGLHVGRLEYTPSNFKNLVLDFKHNGSPLEPGSVLPKGEIVNLILGDGNNSNNQVLIPDLRGKTLEEAKKLILHSFLNTGEIIPDQTIRNENDRLSAFVYHQEPIPDSLNNKIIIGGDIILHLTKDQQKLAALDSLSQEKQE